MKNTSFGAQRPGYPSGHPVAEAEVDVWVNYMQEQGIRRDCCLLEELAPGARS